MTDLQVTFKDGGVCPGRRFDLLVKVGGKAIAATVEY